MCLSCSKDRHGTPPPGRETGIASGWGVDSLDFDRVPSWLAILLRWLLGKGVFKREWRYQLLLSVSTSRPLSGKANIDCHRHFTGVNLKSRGKLGGSVRLTVGKLSRKKETLCLIFLSEWHRDGIIKISCLNRDLFKIATVIILAMIVWISIWTQTNLNQTICRGVNKLNLSKKSITWRSKIEKQIHL